MDLAVVATWIAVGVCVLALAGNGITQIIGLRSTKEDTEQGIKAGKVASGALGQGRGQMDETLKAQGDQLSRTLAGQATGTLNERFAAASAQLGSDEPAVRLSGVYALASLADGLKGEEERESRQACVDVLCAYLRIPYEPDPGQDAPEPQRLAFQASREVRHTAIRVITAHLTKDKDDPASWQGLSFDFTGVVFDGGDFTGAQFTGGLVDFDGAEFSGSDVSFHGARFSGGAVDFHHAQFSGPKVDFSHAQFSGGTVSFLFARFSGGAVDFSSAEVSAGTILFGGAEFSGSAVSFGSAEFSGGLVDFGVAWFSGGTVDFRIARFSGGEVVFGDFSAWSVPPIFPWTGTRPAGVKLPKKKQSTA